MLRPGGFSIFTPPALGIALGCEITCSLIVVRRGRLHRVGAASSTVEGAETPEQALESTADLARAVHKALTVLPRRPRTAAVSLPAEATVLRLLTLPPLGRRAFTKVLRDEISRVVPYNPGEAAVGHMVLERGKHGMRVLVAAARLSHITSVSSAMRRAGLRRWIVEPAPVALARALSLVHPQGSALIAHLRPESISMALAGDGTARSCHTFDRRAPVWEGEVVKEIKRVRLGLGEFDAVYLSGPSATADLASRLEGALGIPVRLLEVGGAPPKEAEAAGSALRLLLPRGARDPHLPRRSMLEGAGGRVGLPMTVAFVAAALLASGSTWYERRAAADLDAVRLERQMPAIAAGEARRLLAERQMLTEALAGLRAGDDGVPWPEVLIALSYSTPPGVRIASVELTAGGEGKLAAESRGDAEARELVRRLAAQPFFSATLEELRTGERGRDMPVQITIRLALRGKKGNRGTVK